MPLTNAQQALVDKVESRIDEITPAGGSPTIPHESLYLELENATVQVLRRAIPELTYSEATDGSGSSAAVGADSTVITLPADFLRFLSLKLDGWRVTMYHLMRATSKERSLQGNPYMQGAAGRPVAVFIPRAGGYGIEAWPAGTITELLYVADKAPEDINEKGLEDAILWLAASRALLTLKESEAAAANQAHLAALQELRFGLLGDEGPVYVSENVRQTQ